MFDLSKKRLHSAAAKFEKKSLSLVGNLALSAVSQNSVKLPKLDLPTFAGRYTEWMSFIDLFSASVDSNSSLSDAQKLQYLKTSVKEEPYRLISSLRITNSNYSVALEVLRKRYANNKVIVREHIHQIVTFAPIRNESPVLLRKLIETVDKNVACLQNLKINASTWDPILVYLVTERVDAITRKDWEQHSSIVTGTELSTYSDLKTFLENRATALEAASSKLSCQKAQPKTLVAHVASDKCPFCK